MRPAGPFAAVADRGRGSAECDSAGAGPKLVVRDVGFLKPEMLSARVVFWFGLGVSITFGTDRKCLF